MLYTYILFIKILIIQELLSIVIWSIDIHEVLNINNIFKLLLPFMTIHLKGCMYMYVYNIQIIYT